MRQQDANRALLVGFLRDEDREFTWDFGVTMCGSTGCAVGAAMHLGIIRRSRFCSGSSAAELCEAIGLPVHERDIFWSYEGRYGAPSSRRRWSPTRSRKSPRGQPVDLVLTDRRDRAEFTAAVECPNGGSVTITSTESLTSSVIAAQSDALGRLTDLVGLIASPAP